MLKSLRSASAHLTSPRGLYLVRLITSGHAKAPKPAATWIIEVASAQYIVRFLFFILRWLHYGDSVYITKFTGAVREFIGPTVYIYILAICLKAFRWAISNENLCHRLSIDWRSILAKWRGGTFISIIIPLRFARFLNLSDISWHYLGAF